MKTILKDTWTILEKKEKKQFIFLGLFDIVISLLDILFLAVLLWIIQFYIQPGQVNRLSFLPHWLADRNSVPFIAAFFFLFGLKNMAGFLVSSAGYQFNSNIAIRISRNSLLNYQQAAFEEFVNTDSSVHIRRISLQPFDFCMNILTGLQQIITQVSLIIITIIAITIFNVKLFILLLLVLLPPVIVVFYIIKKRVTKAKRHIQASNEKSYQHLLDALKGYVESNVYDRNDFFMHRFIRSRKKFSTHLFASLAMQTLPSRVIEIFAVLGLFLLIVIAKWSGIQDSATLITIGAFMAAAYKIIPGIVKIINITGQIKAYEFSV
ncbi:MAG TPA: ABC transporter transmembrane domain-containing protein, partial [Chitinophagaceae bacterium]|nr:ABC transporter transmembrane domain-containing protein [Chitinophagaceae bacterium]